MEDREIIRLLQTRDEIAIRALAAKYGRRLLATARNILGTDEDAEESVNDTYMALWDAIPPREPNPLSGFVYKTGRNQALKKLRHQTAEKRDAGGDLPLEELAGCIPSRCLEEDFEAKLLGQAIDAFLDTIPRDSRILFLRRYWFGDSVKAIARHFAMTENAVSVRLNRTRNQLKAYLLKEGYLYE